MAKSAAKDGTKLIVKNRRAFFEYHVEKTYEAGIQLRGTEVKSLRDGQVNVSDAYASPDGDELYLHNLNIAAWRSAMPEMNHPPTRRRKLLMHRREIDDLTSKVREKGLTLIPLSLYFKNGRVKVELGLCRGKDHGDKRAAIRERDTDREINRAMSDARRR